MKTRRYDTPGPASSSSYDRQGTRLGQTMLELIAATTIIAIALVPALKSMRNNLDSLDRLERDETLVRLCTSQLEQELALTAGTWDLTSSSGHFGPANPDFRFIASKTDSPAEGGVVGELAVIDVVVWHDADGGNDLDADEQQSRLATKLARVISYEYEATIH